MATRTEPRRRETAGAPPRRSTRAPATQETPVLRPADNRPQRRMIRTEAVTQDAPTPVKRTKTSTRHSPTPSAPRVVKSTRNVIRTEPGDVTRTELFTEKREQAKFLAPAQFLLVMFGVVIVSVFAFGLLREDTAQALPEKPDTNEIIEFEPTSTSTNTGILRGNDGGE